MKQKCKYHSSLYQANGRLGNPVWSQWDVQSLGGILSRGHLVQPRRSRGNVHMVFVCLFVLRFNVPLNNFTYVKRSKRFLGIYQILQGVQHGALSWNPLEPRIARFGVSSDAVPPGHRAPLHLYSRNRLGRLKYV